MLGNLKYHVAAGSFHVGKGEKRTLQAFLGTCVGVALFDPEEGVGGLFHILLPEPVSSWEVPMKEKYASTGFPLFLSELYNAGAKKGNLKAVIAGGALVGPLNKLDLSLDIGGRSVEIARKMLDREEIPVERSETGGFFSCCLSLDMETGDVRIDPAGFDNDTKPQVAKQPDREEIAAAMDNLTPIPQVALKILRLVGLDDYDISDIAEEVRKDQVISARTLQLSNSAMFSIRQKIESLDHALLLIGRDQLVKLVLSASVKRLFEPETMGYSLCKGGLYHHAIGTAIIAEKLAEITGKVLPGLAYTAGLLHDIGKVVLDQYVTAAFPLFYRDVSENRQSFLEAEKSILGIDHTEVGYELAMKWDFPESLAAVIRHHHHPEKGTEYRSLTSILYIANLIMEKFNAGLELEQTFSENFPQQLAELGLTISSLPEIVDALPPGLLTASDEMGSQETAAV